MTRKARRVKLAGFHFMGSFAPLASFQSGMVARSGAIISNPELSLSSLAPTKSCPIVQSRPFLVSLSTSRSSLAYSLSFQYAMIARSENIFPIRVARLIEVLSNCVDSIAQPPSYPIPPIRSFALFIYFQSGSLARSGFFVPIGGYRSLT